MGLAGVLNREQSHEKIETTFRVKLEMFSHWERDTMMENGEEFLAADAQEERSMPISDRSWPLRRFPVQPQSEIALDPQPTSNRELRTVN